MPGIQRIGQRNNYFSATDGVVRSSAFATIGGATPFTARRPVREQPRVSLAALSGLSLG